MDYANERWIKVYTRDTAGWLAMSWQAQGLGLLLSRKMEPTTGEISLGRKGLPTVIGLLGPTARWEDVEPFINELLEEGRLEYDDERKVLVDHDHPVRQGAKASGTVRSQRSRATRCNAPQRDATPCNDQREKKESEEETESETRAREESPAAPPEPEPPGAMPEWASKTIDAIATANLMTANELDGVNAWGKFVAKADDEARPVSEPRFRGFMSSWAASVKQRRAEVNARAQVDAERIAEEARSKKRHQQRGMSPPTRKTREDAAPERVSAAELAAPLRALGVGS